MKFEFKILYLKMLLKAFETHWWKPFLKKYLKLFPNLHFSLKLEIL